MQLAFVLRYKKHKRCLPYFTALWQTHKSSFCINVLFTCLLKGAPMIHASSNTDLKHCAWLQRGDVNVVITKLTVTKKIKLRLDLYKKNIFTPLFNWKISAILLVSVINYYKWAIIQQNLLKNSSPYDFGSKVLLYR